MSLTELLRRFIAFFILLILLLPFVTGRLESMKMFYSYSLTAMPIVYCVISILLPYVVLTKKQAGLADFVAICFHLFHLILLLLKIAK